MRAPLLSRSLTRPLNLFATIIRDAVWIASPAAATTGVAGARQHTTSATTIQQKQEQPEQQETQQASLLQQEEVLQQLRLLPRWELCSGGSQIRRYFLFKDFVEVNPNPSAVADDIVTIRLCRCF